MRLDERRNNLRNRMQRLQKAGVKSAIISRKTGISEKTVSKFITEKSNINDSTLVKFEDAIEQIKKEIANI